MILNIPNRPFCTKSKGVNSKDLGFIQYRARKKWPHRGSKGAVYWLPGVRCQKILKPEHSIGCNWSPTPVKESSFHERPSHIGSNSVAETWHPKPETWTQATYSTRPAQSRVPNQYWCFSWSQPWSRLVWIQPLKKTRVSKSPLRNANPMGSLVKLSLMGIKSVSG